MQRKDIVVTGHEGKWYVIDEGFHEGKEVYLLEHQTYGDDAASIIVDKDMNIVMDEVHNGLSDLEML